MLAWTLLSRSGHRHYQTYHKDCSVIPPAGAGPQGDRPSVAVTVVCAEPWSPPPSPPGGPQTPLGAHVALQSRSYLCYPPLGAEL